MSAGLLPFILGVGMTVGFLAVAHATGLSRSRGAWTTTLVSIALFYVVFALEHGGPADVALHTAIAGAFIALAVTGFLRSLWFVVAGLALHGLFDILAPVFDASPAPEWWPAFCLGVDVLLAGALAFYASDDRLFQPSR